MRTKTLFYMIQLKWEEKEEEENKIKLLCTLHL